MRVICGNLRGRTLATPSDRAIRPTTDRTRETIFNVLAHRFGEHLYGAGVLDLFAGTGALGIEALSRGASYCVFIEKSAEGCRLIRTNVENLGLTDRTKIFRRDATDFGDAEMTGQCGVVFVDPPYGRGLSERALCSARDGGWIAPGTLCVVEETVSVAFESGPGFSVVDERKYGETVIRFIELA